MGSLKEGWVGFMAPDVRRTLPVLATLSQDDEKRNSSKTVCSSYHHTHTAWRSEGRTALLLRPLVRLVSLVEVRTSGPKSTATTVNTLAAHENENRTAPHSKGHSAGRSSLLVHRCIQFPVSQPSLDPEKPTPPACDKYYFASQH